MRVVVRLPADNIPALREIADEIGAPHSSEAVRWLLRRMGLTSHPVEAMRKIAANPGGATTPIRVELGDALHRAVELKLQPGEAVSSAVRRLITEAAEQGS